MDSFEAVLARTANAAQSEIELRRFFLMTATDDNDPNNWIYFVSLHSTALIKLYSQQCFARSRFPSLMKLMVIMRSSA